MCEFSGLFRCFVHEPTDHTMQSEKIDDQRPFFKKLKTYSAEEIIAAGGATAFGKLTGFDASKLYNLGGEPITDEELEDGLNDLKRK